MKNATKIKAEDLVICRSGDGWSIHRPGATDEDIATGNAPYLLTGEGRVTISDLCAALEEMDRQDRGAK